MKKVLVLGAGLVAGPLVRYLLDQEEFQVIVASRTLAKARALVGEAPNGLAREIDVNDRRALSEEIAGSDLAVSLLPYVYHPLVAGICVERTKPMVTTSYVKQEMKDHDATARDAGVILLNELGVDPGIDHMSAMQVIDRIKQKGGELVGFSSYCGGLPAPEANDNPFGYKFSWSPRGVLLAGKNPARYVEDDKVVDIPGEELFDHHWPVEVEGLGTLEGYPNRDSLPYMQTYSISGVRSMFRGTLRYPGWCATMRKISGLGFLSDDERDDLADLTFGELTCRLIGGCAGNPRGKLAGFLGVDENSAVISNLEWLGLLGDDPLPAGATSLLDVLTARMLEKMSYIEGERDMLVMQHQFLARYEDRTEKTTSLLIDYGIPGGDSAMSRLVGFPAAIAAKLVLQGEIGLVGVQVPVVPQLYDPILAELAEMGVRFTEKTEIVAS